jgi:serine protease Do
MTRLLPLALLLAGLSAKADPLADLEQAQQQLFERTAPSVVFISTGSALGSGFFVRADGLILTNAHVVGTKEKVDVVLLDGRRFKGDVVERGPDDLDLALVQVPVASAPVLPLANVSKMKVGAWAGAVGHGAGAVWSFNTGMVSNIWPEGAERPVFQTQIPLNHGNSGGPIIDRQGRVLGIVTAGLDNAQAINFGIGIDVAIRALGRLADACDCLVVDAPKNVPVFVDGKMAGKGPRVLVYSEPRTIEVYAVVGGKMRAQQVAWPKVRKVSLEAAP